MNYEEIMMLVKAGYTKEEISAMQTPAEPDQPVSDLQEPDLPVLDLQEHDLPVLDRQEPAPSPVGNDQILAALNQLTQAVITNNINRQAFDTAPQRTAEDALAEIIAPPAAHRNKLGGK